VIGGYAREMRLEMNYAQFKRLMDIGISAIGLVVLSPIMLITALAIKLDSPGPVLYRQQRLGLNGTPFTMYKFRSMYVGAEAGGVYEKKGDPRVTRVGRIIRKTSIDELPQLLNILKGEMSLVGPRPPLTYHPWPYEMYNAEQKRMFDVRPGLTGWAQVNGRKAVEWNRRIELNVEYVENMSLWLDLKILWLTLWNVVMMKDNINVDETVRLGS